MLHSIRLRFLFISLWVFRRSDLDLGLDPGGTPYGDAGGLFNSALCYLCLSLNEEFGKGARTAYGYVTRMLFIASGGNPFQTAALYCFVYLYLKQQTNWNILVSKMT